MVEGTLTEFKFHEDAQTGRNFAWLAVLIAAIVLACSVPMTGRVADPRMAQPATDTADPGCAVATLVSTGGAFPKDPKTLAIRWTGFSNFEIAFNGQIILLDAYFDRGSMFPPLGFKAADVKRANLILIGHGHVDHMSDAASVGAQTAALVVGAPVTTEKLLTQKIDAKQFRTVTGRGGELLEFPCSPMSYGSVMVLVIRGF